MCVIIHFAPNASINKQQLFNAVYNNWHGFGVLLKDGNGRIQLIKEFSESGNDPEKIWKLLNDNKDIERYLHVRYSTKGATDESNVQPFEVYNSTKRQVFFMHNGTLHNYGTIHGGKSDTLDFCEKVLQPSLLKWTGENGKADYLDQDYYKFIIDKYWSSQSAGLFVSNDLAPKRIGVGWSEYKHPDDSSYGEVWVSNTTYFDRIQRGPEFQRLEEIRKAQEEEKRKDEPLNDEISFGHNTNKNITTSKAISKWSVNSCAKDPRVLKAITEIVDRWDLDDPADIVKLKNVTYDEWVAYLTDGDEWTTALLIEHLCSNFAKIMIRNATLSRSKDAAQKRLQEISLKEKEKLNANVKAA